MNSLFNVMFQLKAPDAKLMPIREDVEELFGIEELRVNINVFIVDNRYVFLLQSAGC